MERIMRPIAKEVRNSLGGMLAGAAGSSLIKVTLLGIATKAAANWLKNATSTAAASGGVGSRAQTERGSTIGPRVDTQNIIKTNT
jgi:hypothetical protein